MINRPNERIAGGINDQCRAHRLTSERSLTPLNFTASMQVLVIEPDPALLDFTVEKLSAIGHEVIGISCAEAIDELPIRFVIDMLILDPYLPGKEGLNLARRLRHTRPNMGIIMVTARQTLADKLAGYENGADTYLTKPMAHEELCATVKALARRLRQHAAEQQSAFTLHTRANLLKTPQGELTLRGAEVDLLSALALAPDRTLATWLALEKLNKPVDDQGKAQLEVLVSRLRGKLLTNGVPAMPIKAMRGIGYRLCMPLLVV